MPHRIPLPPPFIITPPISRVDAKSGQTLRIKLGSSAGLAKDKRDAVVAESAGNSAGGGQSEKNEGQNVLQLAIRSRF
ncbi:fimbria/pilus periplasmic chaperone [Klebsiella pneumoniae]|uniref:fimbria/pilus periplasmic chaperone n=1 Tax=Klebsiella pneumoniae TaxID=573 RepID=UPI003B3BD4DD